MFNKLLERLIGARKTTPVKRTIEPYAYSKDGETVAVKKHKRTVHVADKPPVEPKKKASPKPKGGDRSIFPPEVIAMKAVVAENERTIKNLKAAITFNDRRVASLEEDLQDGRTEIKKLREALAMMTAAAIVDQSMFATVWIRTPDDKKKEILDHSDLRYLCAQFYRRYKRKNKIGENLFRNESFD